MAATTKKGKRITKGAGYTLSRVDGRPSHFKNCTVVGIVNEGATRLVVLRVPKN